MSEPTAGRRRSDRAALALALLALAVALSVGVVSFGKAWSTSVSAAPPPEVASLEQVQSGLTWVADKVRPAVVFIEVEGKVEPAQEYKFYPDPSPEEPPFGMPDLPEEWRRFFFGPDAPQRPSPFNPDRPQRQPQPPVGQGSGVVIDPSGYIITNNHVVGEAAKVTVRLANGESYPAEVKGTDKLSDLAVIKIEPKQPLTAAKLGDADAVKVGSFALAIGYPFGGSRSGGRFDEAMHFEPTLTLGVISATNRQIGSDMPGRPFRNLLQTDAPINPGNSGGPLVNIRGEVIGINQAIFTSGFTMGNIGVGFAIPINSQTKDIVEQLKGGAPVVRGRIGVSIEAVTEPIKHDYGVEHGVFVNEVEKDSPGDRAGVKMDDVIVKFAGKQVTSPDQFVTVVQGTKPGTTADMEVVREGKPVKLRITVEALTAESMAQKPVQAETKKLGLTVESLSAEVKEKSGLFGGVLVKAVEPLSDAARAGIRAGDIIVRIGGDPVTDVDSYQKSIAKLGKGQPLTIRIWRTGHYLTAQIESLSQ